MDVVDGEAMKPVAYFIPMNGSWCVSATEGFKDDPMSKYWNGRRVSDNFSEAVRDWWETYTGWELILRVRGVRPSSAEIVRNDYS